MTDEELKYIKANGTVWKELEEEVVFFKKRMTRGKNKHSKDPLTKERVDHFIVLYNQAANHLAYVRTNFGETDTSDYLNKLCTSAHSIIYTKTELSGKKFLHYFTRDISIEFRKSQVFFWIAFALMILPSIVAFIFTVVDERNVYAFMDPNSATSLREEGNYDDFSATYNTFEAVYIGQNNITICLEAFAGGATLGLFTVYIMVQNGLLLGALAGVAHNKGVDAFFWALILPHGVTELFAIALSGAAGFMIAYAIINPRRMSRKNSIITHGLEALRLEGFVVILLVISAIIEGYFTPLAISYWIKYLFAIGMLSLLFCYLFFPGRKKEKHL